MKHFLASHALSIASHVLFYALLAISQYIYICFFLIMLENMNKNSGLIVYES